MTLKIEDPVPPPHLFQGRSATWPSSYSAQTCPLGSSSAIKSSQPAYTYSRMHQGAISSDNINQLPSNGWYDASMIAPNFQCNGYDHYNPPRSSIGPSAPMPSSLQAAQVPSSAAHEPSTKVISPVPIYPQSSLLGDSAQQSAELPSSSRVISQQTPTHLKIESHGQESSQSKFSTMQSVPSTSSWAIDSLGIHTPSLQSESYYTNFLHHVRGSHTSNGEMSVEPILHAPQPRRNFTPIAPQPVDTPRITAAKRARDDEEVSDLFKRRRRSESTTSTQLELTEEDKLLLRLKEEESMPWKDIAARFQNDLGKQYQIPALQMRLKRLRERMRVWSDADVKALRMAHEYWAQNKFDLISQKMLEFGAQEKWTARQCARKWAESDGMPTPVPQYDQHAQHTFTPYSMSPAEPATTFLPYMHS